ncbi:MAG: rRNA maturation RNase YbeY [Planctomycetota bacterium]
MKRPAAAHGKRPGGRGSQRAVPRARLQLELLDRGRPRTPVAFVRRVVQATLAFAERPDLPVSLLLTDDAGIATLHGVHLGDPTPTDVMSFELDGGAEIVVSVQTARRVARSKGHAARAEIALYIVHGLLHTLGYDDVRARDRQRMRRAECSVLAGLDLHVPAVDA